MMRRYGDLTFDIQDTSVRMYYNKQCVIFNTLNSPSRHKFNEFRKELIRNRRIDNINDIYGLATRHEIRGTSGTYMTVHKNIAF